MSRQDPSTAVGGPVIHNRWVGVTADRIHDSPGRELESPRLGFEFSQTWRLVVYPTFGLVTKGHGRSIVPTVLCLLSALLVVRE